MSDETKIIIEGEPIAQARPRFYSKGKIVKVYDSQSADKKSWKWQAAPQVDRQLEGALSLQALFEMPIASSATKRDRAAMIAGEIHHTKKPDNSNMVKWVEDCLNEMAYHDDSAIVDLRARKIYSETPRTTIVLSEVTEPFGEFFGVCPCCKR